MKQFRIISPRFSVKGFTLIELLVVIALLGMLTVGSASTFFSYTKTQRVQAGVSEVEAILNKAKSRAVSQVKPSVCGSGALEGYQFSHPSQGTFYLLRVRCGGAYYDIERKNLPADVTFDSTSDGIVFFNVRTGITGADNTIVVQGNNIIKAITINEVGTITVQ